MTDRKCLLMILGLLLVPCEALGQQTLLQPDWKNPSLVAELNKISNATPGLESAIGLPIAKLPVTLPILGLKLPDKTGLESQEGGVVYAYDPANPHWYSQQFNDANKDFGILVYGTQQIEGSPDNLPKEIEYEFVTEDDREGPTEVTASFVRYGIPYSVTLNCDKEGDQRCTTEGASKAVVDALAVLGGVVQ